MYVSFGTVAAGIGMFPDLYLAAAGALADVPARVLMTTGGSADPAALGLLPPNVHVERWCDEAQVLPQASVVVSHGGFGTLLRILAAGVPMVVVPLFADQGYNARRVHDTGIAIALDGGPAGSANSVQPSNGLSETRRSAPRPTAGGGDAQPAGRLRIR